MLGLTQHAEARMQQRGISSTTLESLLDYGTMTYDHRGGALVFFDKKAKSRLLRNVGRAQYRVMEKQLNAYAVVANDGSVVTVGHRRKRIPRR
jgi:hypothetical protein